MEAPRTVNQLGSFRLSRSVRQILGRAQAERTDEGPILTLAAFIRSAVDAKGGSNTAASIADEMFAARLSNYAFAGGLTPASTSAAMSPGLWQAFQGAVALRGQTGGDDEYVGIRYILFEMLTATGEPLASERGALLTALDVDGALAAHRIAKYCWESQEQPEKPDVWRRVFAERGVDPDNPPVGRAGVALLQPDDPWLGDIRDHAGATTEARAFAATVTANQFQPPMAVGIFGDWGSGKSFFMRLLYKAVEEQTDNKRKAAAREGSTVSFLENVVQIRFNAWHYAETNLWASLVEHIFTQLDSWAEQRNKVPEANRAFDRLATARRLTVEAAEALIDRRRDRGAALTALQTAATIRAAEEERLRARPGTYLEAAWKSLVGSDEARRLVLDVRREAVDKAGKLLGMGAVTASAAHFRTAATALDDELAKHAALRSGVVRALAAPGIVALIAAGTFLLPLGAAALSEAVNATVHPITAAVAGAVAPLALGLSWAAGKATKALTTLQSFRSDLDKVVEARAEAGRKSEEDARAALAEAEAAELEAAKRLEQATEAAAQAALEYNAETGKGRVLSFVRERVAAGEYAKQLSFIATVRKDFEELSRLMTAAPVPPGAEEAATRHQAHIQQLVETAEKDKLLESEELEKLRETMKPPAAEPAVFERIILYIDDLDRCRPHQVVAVLQAIHLLLTFPLFIVFVAVDVRWLRNALATEYEGQLCRDNETAAIASASDYLEKILQVPFWVRPMGEANTRAILEDRMGPEEEGSSPPIPPPPDGSGGEQDTTQKSATPGQSGNEQDAPAPKGELSLRLTSKERIFIRKIAAALDGSPRRTLRFINTYRIVKASFNSVQLDKLERQEGYRAFATLLAIAVSADDIYPVIVRTLKGGAADPLAAVLNEPQVVQSTSSSSVDKAFECYRDAGGGGTALLDYAELIGRFSFHPPHAGHSPITAPAKSTASATSPTKSPSRQKP